MAVKGLFKPKNPNKYKGDVNNIIFRSSYEFRLMNHLDKHQDVLKWGSETIIIPYKSPIDNRYHRYYMDFFVEQINSKGKKETLLIEVKPAKQTKPPKISKKITKKYITEVHTWGVNEAKFKAATEYCKDRGWEFRIFTESELGII